MRWSFALKTKVNPSQFKSSITEEWYKKGDTYKPMQGKQYEWVWEYAQLRYNKAVELGRYVEEKSITVVKFVSAVGTGTWAIFAFLEARSIRCSTPNKVIVVLAMACLVISAIYALLAFSPASHLFLINEEAAIESVEQHDDKQQALGRFVWSLTAAVEFEHVTISKKGRWLALAMYFLTASALLFMGSLFWVVFL